MLRSAIFISSAIVGALGCNAVFGVDDLEFDGLPSDASGGHGGAGARGGATGEGGGAGDGGDVGGLGGLGGAGGRMAEGGGGAGSGAGGQGGQGGAPPALVDRGLLVRYFVDEAASGQMPPALTDHGPAPLFDLPIVYDAMVHYAEAGTGRGLQFPANHDAAAHQVIQDTKVRSDLDGVTAATIEVVFEATSASLGGGVLFMLMQPGSGDGRFGMGIGANKFPYLELNQDSPAVSDASALWNVDVVGVGRIVLQVVVDTTLPTEAERARLFIDGVLAPHHANPPFAVIPPMVGEGIDTCATCELILANRQQGDRFVAGTVYYAAMYTEALTTGELANNVALLTANDDAAP